MYSGIHKSRDKYCGFEIEFKPGNKQDVSVLKYFIYLFIYCAVFACSDFSHLRPTVDAYSNFLL